MSTERTGQIELEIAGMTCPMCAKHVEEALRGVPGVAAAQVPAWQEQKAIVQAQQALDPAALIAAVQEAGYEAKLGRTTEAPAPPRAQKHDADFDLVVIGTGGGGMAAAISGAEHGARVAIVEAGTVGGTCVNIGCVPSKTLIRAAETYHRAAHHPFEGVRTSAAGIDWQTVRAQKDALVAQLRQEKYLDVLQAYPEQIKLIRGRARLDANADVQIDGRTYRAERIVLATGARPKRLPVPGSDTLPILDSTSLMDIEHLPKSLIVLGGRAIALELGQAFARLGTQVTILQRSGRLLPEHEPEIGKTLADTLRAEGIAVETGVGVQELRAAGAEKVVVASVRGERHEFRATEILMATGRVPNTHNLGLEQAGVECEAAGFVRVDAFLQTSRPGVYAAGDVTTLPKFVYVAAASGRLAARNALNGSREKLDISVLPEIVFTDPQVATVGLTEAQARAADHDVAVSTLPLTHVPRALAARDTRGFIKLIADRKTDRLLGAHILAAEGGELVMTAAMAVRFGREHGFTVQDLRGMLFPYLTQVEGIKLAAQTFEKDLARLSCCAA